MLPLQFIITLIAGALIAPSFAPFNIPYLVVLPPALLFLCTYSKTPKQAAWLGWGFGLSFFGSGVSWVFVSMHEHSATPVAIAVALTALFVAALALLFTLQMWLWRKWFSARWVALSFIGLWILFEWLRSWFLTGFPWLYLGNAALNTPLQNIIPIAGVWGASLLWLIIAISAAYFVKTWRLLPLLILPLPLIGAYLLPNQWTQATGDELRVAVVQPNIPQNIKWNPNYRPEVLANLAKLSAEHSDADLLLWPETAIPTLFQNAAAPLAEILDKLDSANTTLISGLPSVVASPDHPLGRKIHNSLATLTVNSGVYHKQRLVPFGEYVPLEDYLRGTLAFFNLPMSSFSLPAEQPAYLELGQYRLSPAICYEIAYPELVRRSSVQSDFILTVSNDTWFGKSIAPAQHLQIAQVRALENGRWVIRGTNNGFSALIDTQGQIAETIPQFSRGVLRGVVPAMQGETPYQTYGHLPLILLMALLAMMGFGPYRARSSEHRFPSFR